MTKFRRSIYDSEQLFLREWLVTMRHNVNLTQRELAERLDVVHSLVGKVEKGERRLDIIEFLMYCNALGADPYDFIKSIKVEKKL